MTRYRFTDVSQPSEGETQISPQVPNASITHKYIERLKGCLDRKKANERGEIREERERERDTSSLLLLLGASRDRERHTTKNT